MLDNKDYADIRRALIDDVHHDYVGLWVVPWLIERFALYVEQSEMKSITLRLLEDLLKQRLIRAGEPAKSGEEFIEWKMSVPDILGRIDAEWTRLGRTPNIGEVVWFDQAVDHAWQHRCDKAPSGGRR